MIKSAIFLSITDFFGTIYRTVRFHSILGFSSVVLMGAILAGSPFKLEIVWALIFSVFSAAFGFIINDLADAELDSLSDVIRNPVSTNELSKGKSLAVTLFFLLASILSLTFLNPQNQLLGLAIIILYLTYSWIIRAKARPVLDIAYHGFCLALLATIGYTEIGPLDIKCILYISIIFLLSSMSQILQEIRDYKTDKTMIKTTVILLGKRRSLILCLALIISTFPFVFLLILKGLIPFELLFLTPLTYFIIAPIIRTLLNEAYEEKMLTEIKERRLILIGILITALILV